MSREPLTISNRLINEFFDYIKYRLTENANNQPNATKSERNNINNNSKVLINQIEPLTNRKRPIITQKRQQMKPARGPQTRFF